jgi:peptidyl-prolyl cis-trans isomerase B (cyclophilin B)
MLVMRSRPIAALALLFALAGLAGCGGDDDKAADEGSDTVSCDYPENPAGAAKEVDPPPADAPSSGDVEATITTSVGDLKATLHQEATPCTVNSFLSLADQGYFDATQCHRLTTEGIFVLQCGDPTGTGTGGPGYSFDDELSGKETYPAGTLAMANAGPNTNGSQFFVVYADTQLPPSYAVFGTLDDASVKIVADVAKKGTQTGGPDGPPKTPVSIESITVD